jgi:multidrug resistance efflux pump
MTKEGMIKIARAKIEQKSQERHFSDESVLNMKRAYEIKCEQYESKIKKLEAQIEKMKNCFNCAKGDWNNRVECIKSGCVNKNKMGDKRK